MYSLSPKGYTQLLQLPFKPTIRKLLHEPIIRARVCESSNDTKAKLNSIPNVINVNVIKEETLNEDTLLIGY